MSMDTRQMQEKLQKLKTQLAVKEKKLKIESRLQSLKQEYAVVQKKLEKAERAKRAKAHVKNRLSELKASCVSANPADNIDIEGLATVEDSHNKTKVTSLEDSKEAPFSCAIAKDHFNDSEQDIRSEHSQEDVSLSENNAISEILPNSTEAIKGPGQTQSGIICCQYTPIKRRVSRSGKRLSLNQDRAASVLRDCDPHVVKDDIGESEKAGSSLNLLNADSCCDSAIISPSPVQTTDGMPPLTLQAVKSQEVLNCTRLKETSENSDAHQFTSEDLSYPLHNKEDSEKVKSQVMKEDLLDNISACDSPSVSQYGQHCRKRSRRNRQDITGLLPCRKSPRISTSNSRTFLNASFLQTFSQDSCESQLSNQLSEPLFPRWCDGLSQTAQKPRLRKAWKVFPSLPEVVVEQHRFHANFVEFSLPEEEFKSFISEAKNSQSQKLIFPSFPLHILEKPVNDDNFAEFTLPGECQDLLKQKMQLSSRNKCDPEIQSSCVEKCVDAPADKSTLPGECSAMVNVTDKCVTVSDSVEELHVTSSHPPLVGTYSHGQCPTGFPSVQTFSIDNGRPEMSVNDIGEGHIEHKECPVLSVQRRQNVLHETSLGCDEAQHATGMSPAPSTDVFDDPKKTTDDGKICVDSQLGCTVQNRIMASTTSNTVDLCVQAETERNLVVRQETTFQIHTTCGISPRHSTNSSAQCGAIKNALVCPEQQESVSENTPDCSETIPPTPTSEQTPKLTNQQPLSHDNNCSRDIQSEKQNSSQLLIVEETQMLSADENSPSQNVSDCFELMVDKDGLITKDEQGETTKGDHSEPSVSEWTISECFGEEKLNILCIIPGKVISTDRELDYVVRVSATDLQVWMNYEGGWRQVQGWSVVQEDWTRVTGFSLQGLRMVAFTVLWSSGSSAGAQVYRCGEDGSQPCMWVITNHSPTRTMVGCALHADEMVVGSFYTEEGQTRLQKYTVGDSLCEGDSTLAPAFGHLQAILPLEGRDQALVGMTTNSKLHIWNHAVGVLLTTIDLSGAVSLLSGVVEIKAAREQKGLLFVVMATPTERDVQGCVVVVNPITKRCKMLHKLSTNTDSLTVSHRPFSINLSDSLIHEGSLMTQHCGQILRTDLRTGEFEGWADLPISCLCWSVAPTRGLYVVAPSGQLHVIQTC